MLRCCGVALSQTTRTAWTENTLLPSLKLKRSLSLWFFMSSLVFLQCARGKLANQCASIKQTFYSLVIGIVQPFIQYIIYITKPFYPKIFIVPSGLIKELEESLIVQCVLVFTVIISDQPHHSKKSTYIIVINSLTSLFIQFEVCEVVWCRHSFEFTRVRVFVISDKACGSPAEEDDGATWFTAVFSP